MSPGDSSKTDPIPTQLGRYQLLEKLGQGGMGEVYLAHDAQLDRRVALKVLPEGSVHDPDAVARFRREARALAKLSHAGIVQAYDSDADDGRHFLVMEYVAGHSLNRVLREQGRLPPALAADFIRQAALALQHAHDRGLVHRDLKPANLLLTLEGRVKLLDLGLARFLQDQVGEPGLTREGAGLGTPDYCAPEQSRDAHAADPRSDIYALGCTLYHMLTGRVPFPGSSLKEKFEAHAHQEPTPVEDLCPDLTVGLALVVRRMMAKDPRARFASAGAVAEALAPFVSASLPSGLDLQNTAGWDGSQLTLGPGRAGPSRRRWVVAATALAFAGLLGLLAGLLIRPRDEASAGPGARGGDNAGARPPAGKEPDARAAAPLAAHEPGVLTVAQDGTGRFRTLKEALEAVDRPGMTVRILDAGTYAEAVEIKERATQADLRLEAPRRATLAPPPGTKIALSISNVSGVTVRGLRVRAAGGPAGAAAVAVYGRSPGVLLDDLEILSPARKRAYGMSLENLEIAAQEPPVVVQNCSVRPGNSPGIRVSGFATYHVPLPSRRVILRENRVERCPSGIALVGALESVQVVGNRVWGSDDAGIQLENLLPPTKGLLLANNTLLNCRYGLRLWDSAVKGGKDIQIRNNLILDAREADLLFTDSGGDPENPRGPGDGAAVRAAWTLGHNWREGQVPPEGSFSRKAWIPADAPDVLRERIAVRARKPGEADFLRPVPDSPLASEGAGKTDPALPAYVGAVPPAGVEAWDWHRTWLAPPPGRLLTVSQAPEDRGEFRTLGAALAQAKPWTTVRVLDGATYCERLILNDPGRYEGLVLEAPKGATLEIVPQTPMSSLEIRDVPHVRVRGFRFAGESAVVNGAFVLVAGHTPGVTLERIDFQTTEGANAVVLERVRAEPGEDPVMVRDCTCRVGNTGVVIIGPADDTRNAPLSQGIVVLRNRVSGGIRGIFIQGGARRVLVAGNLLWNCSQAALQSIDFSERSGQIVYANNTCFDSTIAFRAWNEEAETRPVAGQLELCNNLFFEARTSDLMAAVALEAKGSRGAPTFARAAVQAWRFDHNWRDSSGNEPQGRFPFAPGDKRLDSPKFASRDPDSAAFMRPAAGQRWARDGAGRHDPALPGYVGTVPPSGVAPWDWSVTWRARLAKEPPAGK